MMQARVLVVEDEVSILRVLLPTLEAAGADVRAVSCGADAMALVREEHFDIVLLDLGLPDVDGQELIPSLRNVTDAPIVVLSARGREQDRILALDAGAEDFVPKPFLSGELMARLRAVLRRRPDRKISTLSFGDMIIYLNSRRATIEGHDVLLSRREHLLLITLANAAGNPVTHQEISKAVWGGASEANPQFIRVLVAQLRQKIEAEPSRPLVLLTEPGVGYRLQIP